jgi:hypothetical protein
LPNTIGATASDLRAAAAAASAAAARAVRTSRYSANAPASAPPIVGSAYPADASCLVSAAAAPMMANKASPANPAESRRTARMPTAIAYRNTTTNTPSSNTVLSLVPNVEVAQSFTASGVWLMATEPTAITGEAAGIEIPASNCAMPMAAAAASSPHTAPSQRDGPTLGVMHV